MIEVQDLSKSYGPRLAVDGISFSVPRGEILGFLGPNGAGKSTTMRILTGYLSATAGTASIAGFDVFRDPLEVRRRIGYLPENNPLYNEMRVSDYLQLCCRLRGVPPRRRAGRVDYSLDVCGLSDRRRDIVGRLSKGLRQRVGLAQAVVHDPELLILDEPTSGLDPAQTRETRDLIVALGRDHTVILSSHILPEVSATCQRVVIINKGVLVADDRPENLARRMSEGHGIDVELTVRGDAEAIRAKLSAVRGLDSVEVLQQPDGDCAVKVHSSAADPREELARAIVKGGFGLRELHSRTLSLEDVFISLTTQEPAPWQE
ncbi:MAG: ABC transporter ATP-binding protein [Candidatus Dormibacteraeota bacterium]|nr:ABC transporter ATP-binding protein [Candidatus Dormibacteraeota bacterium]